MLRPRWFKVLSDLWDNKIRSLLVVASIAVGLFAVGMIASMYFILTEDMRSGYAAVNPANIKIVASPFDEDLVEVIRNHPDVLQVEGARSLTLRAFNGEEWLPIDIQAFPNMGDKQVNQVSLLEGAWPPSDDEIVVDRYKLADLHAELGDTISVELPSGKMRKLRLVGVIHDQTIGAMGQAGGFFLAPIQGYVTLETLPWLEQPYAMNNLYVTVRENPNDTEHIRQIAGQLSDKVEDAGVVVFSTGVNASDNHPNSVYIQAIASVLFLLGFLVVFLSTFLITNTLSALLNQQMHQIGVMKTIGARRGQIMSIYMALIFVFGLAAFLIAMPLSSRVSYTLLELLGGVVNIDLQGYRFISLAVYLQLAIALIVPQAAGFLPILRGTRVPVVEALSDFRQEASPGRKDWLDQQLRRIRGASRPMRISLRNTIRRKGRLALTLITLTMGGAMFIATFNVQGSLSRYIGRIEKYFRADVNLTLDRSYRISEITSVVEQVPGVGSVEGWAVARGEMVMADDRAGESVTLLAPPAGSPLVEPILLEGRWIIPGDQNVVAVNERFREIYPDLEVGDTLRLKINGEETDLSVIGFFQLSGKSGGYLAYTSYEYLSGLIHEDFKANTYRVMADRPGLTLDEQKALGRLIESRLEQRGITVTETSAGLEVTDSTADGLNILTGFLLVMASLIAIVGGISLTGTLSMNVLERTREIGIIRSIGASNRMVVSLVVVEGLLIGLFSWLLGTVFAFPISTFMSNAVNLALFGALAYFTFTPTGVIVWLIVVLALSFLASAMPARNAVRLTIREVLAYE
jgi:putative ABC transport system permease protein